MKIEKLDYLLKDMTAKHLVGHLRTLDVSQIELSSIFRVNPRTVRRWCSGEIILPGPVKAAVDAWMRCKRYGLNWRDCIKTDVEVE